MIGRCALTWRGYSVVRLRAVAARLLLCSYYEYDTLPWCMNINTMIMTTEQYDYCMQFGTKVYKV